MNRPNDSYPSPITWARRVGWVRTQAPQRGGLGVLHSGRGLDLGIHYRSIDTLSDAQTRQNQQKGDTYWDLPDFQPRPHRHM